MKIVLNVLLVSLCLTNGFSQSANYTFKIGLPTHDHIAKMQWADIDNDSLLDVIVGYKNQSAFIIAAFLNKKNNPWPIQTLISTTYSDQNSFVLGDVNKDGKIDVIILNETTVLTQYYINNGNLTFSPGEGWGSREVFI